MRHPWHMFTFLFHLFSALFGLTSAFHPCNFQITSTFLCFNFIRQRQQRPRLLCIFMYLGHMILISDTASHSHDTYQQKSFHSTSVSFRMLDLLCVYLWTNYCIVIIMEDLHSYERKFTGHRHHHHRDNCENQRNRLNFKIINIDYNAMQCI